MNLYQELCDNKVNWEYWTPDNINTYLEQWYKEQLSKIDSIKPSMKDNPLQFYEDFICQFDYLYAVISEVDSMVNNKGYSSPLLKVQQYSNDLKSKLYTNETLKQLIEKYEPIDDEEKRYKQLIFLKFRKQPQDLLNQYDKLIIQFKNNVIKNIAQSEIVIDYKEGLLDGLDPIFVTQIRQDDKIVLKITDYYRLNILQFAASSELRERFWHFLQERQPPNDTVAEQMLELKQRIAELYGHRSICELNFENRMVDNVTTIENFLIKLRDMVKPQYLKDIKMLEKKYGISKMMPWDMLYYFECYKKEKFYFDVKKMEQYFEFEPFIKRATTFLEDLYQIEMRPVQRKTWHDDVILYDVYKNKEFLATMHLDLLQRDHKTTGAHVQKLGPQMMVIMCNFPSKPKEGQHLLSLKDVQTFLHECGHNFHEIISRTKFQSNSGINVFYDFIEVPSQFMENFINDYKILSKLAIDKDGNKISEDIFKQYIQYQQNMNSHTLMRQLQLNWIDFSLHRNMNWQKEEPEGQFSRIDIFLQKQLKDWTYDYGIKEYTIYRSFMHIFYSIYGYTCGYYSYLWSDVIQASLFEHYQKTGNFQEYIDKVLVKGNAVDPNQLIKDYAGEYTFNAFKKKHGIE